MRCPPTQFLAFPSRNVVISGSMWRTRERPRFAKNREWVRIQIPGRGKSVQPGSSVGAVTCPSPCIGLKRQALYLIWQARAGGVGLDSPMLVGPGRLLPRELRAIGGRELIRL